MIIRKVAIVFFTLILFIGHPLQAQTADSLYTDTLQKVTADTTTYTDSTANATTDSTRANDTLQLATDSLKGDSTVRDSLQLSEQQREGYEVKGKVMDKNTGEGIPFAVVFFPNSSIGAPADLEGNFKLKFDVPPNDTLKATAMGYTAYVHLFDKSRHHPNMVIEMERGSQNLNEVVVHAGKDPALVLLENIIRHKPYNNPDKISNYKCKVYNKLEADLERLSKSQFEKIPLLKQFSFIYNNLDTVSEAKPFLPLYFTESLSEYYYRKKPKKQREFIKAVQLKGIKNQSIIKFMGTMYQSVNIYDNFIPVFDKEFVSPISNSGYFYYKYQIKDTEEAYGHKIILVQFEPRRNGENCFYGDFWVVDSSFAIQRMSMQVPKVANVNYVNKVSLYKEYKPIDTFWFCTKDKFIANFTAPYNLKIPGFIGRKTTTYSNIVINDTSVTNVLDDDRWKQDVIVPDSAKNHSDAYWTNARPDTLTKNEKAVYKMIDTLKKIPLARAYKNLFTLLVTGVKNVGPLQLGPYWYIYSHNSIEGNRFRISLGTSPKFAKDLHLTGYVAYGDKDQRFKYQLTGLWLLNRKPRSYIYAAYTHDIDHSTNYYDQVGADNIFSAIFRKPGIPWKLAFTDESRLEYYKQFFSGFSYKLTLLHRQFAPFDPLPSTGIFYDEGGQPTNKVVSTDATLSFRFAYKEKYLEGHYLRVSLGSKYPIVALDITNGAKGIWNSAYNYQRLRFTVSDHVKIAPFGSIYYNIFAGKYFGTLPYPLLEIHPGNEYLYYNAYAFEMMNKYEFISDQYAGFNFEHNIGGGIFNYIPYLKWLKLRQFWTVKGVIGSLSDANKALNLNKGYPFRTLEGNPYIEIGTGISNIFEIFRIDFVWRVTPKPLPTEAKSRYFGVFGSVRFKF